MKITKIIIAVVMLLAVQFPNIHAQEPLTAKKWLEIGNKQNGEENFSLAVKSFSECLSLDKTSSICHLNRGLAYFFLDKSLEAIADYTRAIKLKPNSTDAYIYRGIAYAEIKNYAQAKKDLSKALEISPNNKAATEYLAKVTVEPKVDFNFAIDDVLLEKIGAGIELSNISAQTSSNIIGYVYQADYSKSKIFYPSDLSNTVPKAIVVKGDVRTVTSFDSVLLAKEFSKKKKQANVIVLDKQTKKYSLYELIIGENSPAAVQLAETPLRNALNNERNVPMTYEALKISPDYSLQVLPSKLKGLEVADIVDAEGLSLIKKANMQLMAGSKGIRLLFESELEKSNFDEALKIYQWLEKLNINNNDLDVVKITRKTNLFKMFAASEKLKPFVEAEMTKWKYAEADKMAVRGTKTQGSSNSSQPDVGKTNPTATPNFTVGETAVLLMETLNGKFDFMESKRLVYVVTMKKSNETFRYRIGFEYGESSAFTFKWEDDNNLKRSEKLVITDKAFTSASKYVNFFSKTTISPDTEITFILSQALYKDMKAKNEISLDLGAGLQRLSFNRAFTPPSGVYTNKNIKKLHFQTDNEQTQIQILDDPICPLIVGIETPEYTLTLVKG